jgi:DNA modification methylase
MNFEEIISKLPKPYYRDNQSDIVIYHADCRDMLPLIPDKSIDLVLTSPPYDNLREYGGQEWEFKQTANGLVRVVNCGGVIVWIVGDSVVSGSESGNSFRQALYFKDTLELNLYDTMIYLKNSCPFPTNDRYNQIFEYMFVLSKGKPLVFNPIKRQNNYGSFTRTMTHRNSDGSMNLNETVKLKVESNCGNVWLYDVGYMKSSKTDYVFDHPAIYPEGLAFDHISSWSNGNNLILDTFLGSGTTAYCAKKLGRKCIGIEIEEKYCEIAAKRLNQSVMSLEV